MAQVGAAAVTFTAWPLLATEARMALVGASAKAQPAVTLKIELPVTDCPSGLVMVTFLRPADAPTVEMSTETVVGLM